MAIAEDSTAGLAIVDLSAMTSERFVVAFDDSSEGPVVELDREAADGHAGSAARIGPARIEVVLPAIAGPAVAVLGGIALLMFWYARERKVMEL
jgi:hypothetical protein